MRSKRQVPLPRDLGDLDGDTGPVWCLLPARSAGAGTGRRARVPAEAAAHGPRLTLTHMLCGCLSRKGFSAFHLVVGSTWLSFGDRLVSGPKWQVKLQ